MATVGVVGVGAMGSVLVDLFRRAGLETLVYDVSPEAMQRAAVLGARACGSPAEVAQGADVVDVMVRTDEQMLDSVLGASGVFASLARDKPLLLHSTILPSTTQKIGEVARERGTPLVDACITAVPEVLRAYRAATLVGGDKETVERLTPHLHHIAPTILHMGPLGCGNAAKIVRNLMNGTQTLILNEAFQIAAAAGVEPEMLVQVVEQVRAAQGPIISYKDMARRGPAWNLYEAILPRARALADALELEVPITRLLSSADKPLA